MKRSKIIGQGLVHALATVAYVGLVVKLINFVGNANVESEPSLLAPVAFLLLFMISAAITASLVFGRPLLWYLDKKKDEAVALAVYTVAWLFVAMLCVFSIVLVTLGFGNISI